MIKSEATYHDQSVESPDAYCVQIFVTRPQGVRLYSHLFPYNTLMGIDCVPKSYVVINNYNYVKNYPLLSPRHGMQILSYHKNGGWLKKSKNSFICTFKCWPLWVTPYSNRSGWIIMTFCCGWATVSLIEDKLILHLTVICEFMLSTHECWIFQLKHVYGCPEGTN